MLSKLSFTTSFTCLKKLGPVALLVFILASGCAKQEGEQIIDPNSGTVIEFLIESPTIACPEGKFKLVAGQDKNGNKVLDVAEILKTAEVCNAAGSITVFVPQAAGTACKSGGYSLKTGIDANKNSVLEASETTRTELVCDSNIQATALIALSKEPTGTNCPNGGYKISTGTDTNKNGVLETTEIQKISYICQSSHDPNYLTSIKVEKAGTNCTLGGYLFKGGVDANKNGLLEAGEVSVSTYICNNDPAAPPIPPPGPKKQYIVYVGGLTAFYALSAEDGSIIWQKNNAQGFAYSTPLVDKGTVYVGGIDGYMYALDAATGQQKWSFFTDATGIESSPALANGILYFGSKRDVLYAVNASTGQLVWGYRTSENVSTDPVIYNGNVYFGSSDNGVYALNAATGAEVWKFYAGAMINHSSPTINNNTVFVGSRDEHLYALNATTGKQIWKYNAGTSLEHSNPVVHNGLIYIGGAGHSGAYKGSLFAINQATGQLAWESIKNTENSADPLVVGNRVFISAALNFFAVDALTGAVLWNNQILPNNSGAAAANGVIFISGGGTGGFYALHEINGLVKWKNETIKSLIMSKPRVVDENGVMVP